MALEVLLVCLVVALPGEVAHLDGQRQRFLLYLPPSRVLRGSSVFNLLIVVVALACFVCVCVRMCVYIAVCPFASSLGASLVDMVLNYLSSKPLGCVAL